MEVIKVSDVIKNVPNKWYEFYKNWKDYGDKWDKKPITEALLALGNDPKKEDIDRIIGNDSWTTLKCDSCRENTDMVISFEINGGEYRHDLCRECLSNGYKLLTCE